LVAGNSISRSTNGRTILGPAEKVRKFDKRDLSDFVSENYSPDRLILAAAGGVKHEEIVSLAKEQFGSLKSSKIKYSTDPINLRVESLEERRN
jgi:predicted Zn-dependent peptidase